MGNNNKLPYQELLEKIANTPEDIKLYDQVTSKFKTWINNQTRLNATNMNSLVAFIRSYSQEVGSLVEGQVSETLDYFVQSNAGWKVSPNLPSSENVEGGEIFNNYVRNSAPGKFSHAEGDGTEASGDNSHAEGSETIASGLNSHAQGKYTEVSGSNSFGGGTNTSVSGDNTFGFGEGIASGYSNQFIVGRYNNNSDNTVFEVGYGTSNADRKNIFSVEKDGTVLSGTNTLSSANTANTLTPKGYVDAEIERLDKNVWLGYIDVTSKVYHNTEAFIKTLNDATKDFTKDTNPPSGRNAKNGDQITVKITDPSSSDPEYPEIWMFRDPDPKDPSSETPGKWLFFSSLQQLVDASKTAKGLVRIGDNINVNSEGLISVSAATNSVFGVVKLGGNIINDQNNNLSFEWNEF